MRIVAYLTSKTAKLKNHDYHCTCKSPIQECSSLVRLDIRDWKSISQNIYSTHTKIKQNHSACQD